MPIGTPVTLLSTGSGTAGTTYTTATASPSANVLLILFVSSGAGVGTPTPPSSISGLGLTWTQRKEQLSNNNNVNSTIYTAMTPASPPSGAMTITFPSSVDNAGWKLIEVPGAIASTNAASTSVANSSPNVSLPTAPAASSAVFAFLSYNAGSVNTMTPTSPLVKLGTDADTPGSPANQLSAAWDNPPSPNQNVAYSTTNSSNKNIIGYEVLEASAPTNPPNANATQVDSAFIDATSSTAGSGGSISYSIAQNSGTTTTPTVVSTGKWVIARHATDTLVYTITVTESPSNMTDTYQVSIDPPNNSIVRVRNAANTAWV